MEYRALAEERLNFYYGVGAHVGVWNGRKRNGNPWFKEDRSYTVIGIDAMVAIEYTFSKIPFNVSLDYKPGFNIIGHIGFWRDEFGLSLRYTIK